MNKNIKLSLVVIAALVSAQSFAQGRPSLSIGPEIGVPAGDLNTTQKIGVGGSAKVGFPIGVGTDITVSAGYVSFSGDEFGGYKYPALNFIPLKAGVRYKIAPGGFYLEPQLGFTSINTPSSSTEGHGGFTYAANAGILLNKVELSARYEAVSRKNENLPFIGFRAAYNIGL